MPRVKSFSREEALQKAIDLFWEKGYASTSLEDLTTHLGIGKGSFYATFQSKHLLFRECFESYRCVNTALLKQLLDTEPDVKKGYRKLLEFNLEHLLQDEKQRGCLMANTCSEIVEGNEETAAALADHYTGMEQILAAYLRRGGVGAARARSIAAMTITFMIGMSQQSRINRDEQSYRDSIEQLVGMLDRAEAGP